MAEPEVTYYCERSDVEAVYGLSNVAKWADLDNDGDTEKIEARITKALAWAQEEIDSYFRGGRYALPLVKDDDPPMIILDVAAELAGVWLYENRGVVDFSPESGQPVHRLSWNRKRAYAKIKEIVSGQRVIDADPAVEGSDDPVPKAVRERHRHHGDDPFSVR